MYYIIENQNIDTAELNNFFKNQDGFAVLKSSEWNNTPIEQRHGIVLPTKNTVHFCKIERYSDRLSGSFHIPQKKHSSNYTDFLFFIFDRKIIFIDNNDFVNSQIEKLLEGKGGKTKSLEKFFYEFLVLLLEEEPLYLESLERRISKLEEHILDGSVKNFNFQMLEIKKEISRIHRYYDQLVDIGETLVENKDDFFGRDDNVTFPIFTKRTQRLLNEIQSLRDYAMQVQEVYQSEISIRQNDVMKVLTIVTTLFLPLSLIAAWYGMNFLGMPELSWKYGYLFVIVLSAAVVGLCIWVFKKKKFF